MPTTPPRAVSLFQPTAESIHLGNYLGALRQWVPMQDEFEVFFGIADLHAVNENPDSDILRERTLRSAAQLIAGGIDPEKSPLFLQSAVPEHTQLMWVLACLTGFGQASRMTQFKDKSGRRGAESVNVGLFTYPVLMAADILLYQANKVPVGDDQRQHLELTRDLAERFNGRFGPTFAVPEAYILKLTARVLDLADPSNKMSKSSESQAGVIRMLDEPAVSVKKVKSAVTDSDREIRYDPEAKPGVSNLLEILSALGGEPIEALIARFAGKGYGDLKGEVADAVAATVTPFRERTLELLDDRAELEAILASGAERARAVAAGTLADVYAKVGLR